MNKIYIFLLLALAVFAMILFTTASETSTYVNFSQAKTMAESGNSDKIHVVGELKKSIEGDVVGIENGPNNLSFSFMLIDDAKHEERVLYFQPMPTDFQKSEKVVVVGNFQNGQFVAEKILMKCPSKYQNEEIKV